MRALVRSLFAAAVLLAPLPALAQSGQLTILHINDVYEIAPVNGKGGLAELATLLKRERAAKAHTVTLIPGDFLSPSLLSGMVHGAQMIDLFNAVGVDLVSFGNHEFDFGPEVARQRLAESRFPWLASNMVDDAGRPWGGAVPERIVPYGELKVGYFAVIDPHSATLSGPGPGVRFLPVVDSAKAAVKRLRDQGAHVVVALTHLTFAEDKDLAAQVPGINVIIGGHNHDPMSLYEHGVLIAKAGQDAEYLGVIDLDVRTEDAGKGPVTTVLPQWRFVSTAGIAADAEVGAKVAVWNERLDRELEQVLGTAAVELDSRKETVRSRESRVSEKRA